MSIRIKNRCSDIEYIVNHVFYPLKRPQEAEQCDSFHLDAALVTEFANLGVSYLEQMASTAALRATVDMLQGLQFLHGTHAYSAEDLEMRLRTMNPGSITAFLVRKQNCGVTIRLSLKEAIFEAFEASAPAEKVISCTGKLITSFPGPCVAIPRYVFDDSNFLQELCSFLAQMNIDELDESSAHTKKAGVDVREVRDSAHPCMITDLLLAILAAIDSKKLIPPGKSITKRLADDVLWNDAYAPWRRSPLYLIIRVVLQTSLDNLEYKIFMLHVMSSIALKAVSADPPLSDDFISAVRSKLVRRLTKLGNHAPHSLVCNVNSTCKCIFNVLQSRWERHRMTDSQTLPPLKIGSRDVQDSTDLRLTNCLEHLAWLDAYTSSPSSTKYTTQHTLRCNELPFQRMLNMKLSFASGEDLAIGLHDFEQKIADDMDKWLVSADADPRILEENLKCYYEIASDRYSGNPEDESTMILTLLELWRGIDMLVTRELPLLCDYQPEVSPTLVEPLLIRTNKDIGRVQNLVAYLKKRQNCALSSSPSVFRSGPPSDDSFSVRHYYNDSSMHSLNDAIENHAVTCKAEKLQELEKKKKERNDISARIQNTPHSEHYERHKKKKKCMRCRLENQRNIKINPYEWPVPSNDNLDGRRKRKNIIFELLCPPHFSLWRNITYYLLHDILTPPHPKRELPSETFGILPRYMQKAAPVHSYYESRLILMSKTKSFNRSHYGARFVENCSEDDVILPHGLTWELADSNKDQFIESCFHTADTLWRCTFQLPDKMLYGPLEFTLATTSHTENQVLAMQDKCTQGISLHEFIAFGCLRSGSHLQWRNLLRAISSHSLTFHRLGVHVLISHAIQQIGELSDTEELTRHVDLFSTPFCRELLHSMGGLLDSISGNWKEAISLRSIALIIIRMLATGTQDDDIVCKSTKLLRRAREIAFEWIQSIIPRIAKAESHLTDSVKRQLCEIACTCRMTCDIPGHEQAMTQDDLRIYLYCGIVINNNNNTTTCNISNTLTRVLLDRNLRISCLHEHWLRQCISAAGNMALDAAIRLVWSNFYRETGWQSMEGANNQRWIVCKAKSGQFVRFNLLDGTLLVNGRPIGLLPKSITSHTTYRRLFGNTVLHVIPAELGGFEYKSVHPIEGLWEVFFAIRDNVLAISTRNTKTGTFVDYIPYERLNGDLPTLFVEEYTHWRDRFNNHIDFRPISKPWEVVGQWTINLSHRKMFPTAAPERLQLDIHSQLFSNISMYFQQFENPLFLAISWTGSRISIALPRFKLAFYLSYTLSNPVVIHCETFPGMVLDEHQDCGTLHGLANKLVLRRCDDSQLTIPQRMLLIPQASVDEEGESILFDIYYHSNTLCSQVSVNIDIGKKRRLLYMRYDIDTVIGTLRGDGSLQSELLRVYLHALTSTAAPDPLTGRTGVEEALTILGSASCQSFMCLSNSDIKLLKLIRALTPQRDYYPRHLKKMQTVFWDSELPVSTQSNCFEDSVVSVIRGEQNMASLFPKRHTISYEERSPTHLLSRSEALEAIFTTTDALTPSCKYGIDVTYETRMQSELTKQRFHFSMAKMVWTKSVPARFSRSLFSYLSDWGEVFRHELDMSGQLLQYSKEWLHKNDFGKSFLDIYQACRLSSIAPERKRFRLLFTLAAFSINGANVLDLGPWFSAVALHTSDFLDVHPPHWTSYTLADGTNPQNNCILDIVGRHTKSLSLTPSHSLPSEFPESYYSVDSRRRTHYHSAIQAHSSGLTELLSSLWQSQQKVLDSDLQWPRQYQDYWQIDSLVRDINSLFESCSHNIELKRFADRVDAILARFTQMHPALPVTPLSWDTSYISIRNVLRGHAPSLNKLLELRPPPTLQYIVDLPPIGRNCQVQALEYSSEGFQLLEKLLASFGNQDAGIAAQYTTSLLESLKVLRQTGTSSSVIVDRSEDSLVSQSALRAVYETIEEIYRSFLQKYVQALAPIHTAERTKFIAGLWPSITIRVLLFQLTQTRWSSLTREWKVSLIQLCQILIRMQRFRRILQYSHQLMHSEMKKELENVYELDLDSALAHPDWLLIQIGNNFTTREVQTLIAHEMLSPSASRNIVLQLNMGEGKSSVIVPMLATAVADKQTLARVVILKPLAQQTFQLLRQRVSFLPNRRVYYLPFSRDVKMDPSNIRILSSLYEECMRDGGVVVAQPEHILSFKLLSIERLLASNTQIVKLYRHLECHSRDILDESDELLHVRYQLIYTMGDQSHFECHPHRWKLAEEVLALAAKHIHRLKSENDASCLEVKNELSWAFPNIKLPNTEEGQKVVEKLVGRILDDIVDGYAPTVNIPTEPMLKSASIFYLTTQDDAQCVKEYVLLEKELGGNSADFNMLLILRGMLLQGLLVYVLQDRRWRVDYGLDLSRSMLAVPYRAKDVPSVRAEFGHPEITILLTCLSYYYGGLKAEEINTCLRHLFTLSDPKAHYDIWIADIPKKMLLDDIVDPAGINMDDYEQLKRVHTVFRFSQGAINFYLNAVVFPRSAKRFPHKLPCSSWDLAEERVNFTIGFSGTNDNRYLLPTSIAQVDPVGQGGTNALVLTHLLNPANTSYSYMAERDGSSLSGPTFIENMVKNVQEIRVLLDVGAQILDMSNEAFALLWLQNSDKKVVAAIFFNEGDQLTTVTRDGALQPLFSSPYRDDNAKCIVYLDDAHTRGTDLKLPKDWTAAVTLGKKVTKDRLVQGCMRMRQFGKGQRIAFFSPPEIDIAIRLVRRKQAGQKIDAVDVIWWSMTETCSEVRHHAPNWAQHGIDYMARRKALDALPEFPMGDDNEALRKAWLQPEARSLVEMYAKTTPFSLGDSIPDDIKQRLELLGMKRFTRSNMDEEQEREVIHEIEIERQLERPPPKQPYTHNFTPALRTLVSGKVSVGFHRLSRLLEHIRYWSDHSATSAIFSFNFFATPDYYNTVKASHSPEYMKPVQWVLSVKNITQSPCLILVSQFEANELVPMLRKNNNGNVSLNTYWPRVSKSMPAFDEIDPFQLGKGYFKDFSSLILQLNLFAGQLYPSSMEDCRALANFLGIANDPSRNLVAQPDKFVKKPNRDEDMMEACSFVESSIQPVRELIAIRRKDQEFDLTPMGRLLNGHLLQEKDILQK